MALRDSLSGIRPVSRPSGARPGNLPGVLPAPLGSTGPGGNAGGVAPAAGAVPKPGLQGHYPGLRGEGVPDSVPDAIRNASQVANAASLAAATVNLFGGRIMRGAYEEQLAANRFAAELNAKRVARRMRYQQGVATTEAAALGGGQFGSMLYTFADNARAAAENVRAELLNADLQAAGMRAQRRSAANAARIDFVGALLGAGANTYMQNVYQDIRRRGG